MGVACLTGRLRDTDANEGPTRLWQVAILATHGINAPCHVFDAKVGN